MAAYQDNFFTRGPSPLARLTFFGLAAIAIMIADHRFQALGIVRVAVSSVLTPIEHALMWPGQVARDIGEYFVSKDRLLAENRALNDRVLKLAAEGQRATLLAAEQANIEAVQQANARFQRDGVVAEIIRDARNPFARKVIINRGYSHGLKPGAAVIDGTGVVGQVTSLGATSAEVTLTTEKDQSVPVMVLRTTLVAAPTTPSGAPLLAAQSSATPPADLAASSTAAGDAVAAKVPAPVAAAVVETKAGLRAIAVGTGRDGTIDLPFIPVAADVQVGDQLVTSGIDGTYPAGLLVATVTVVDKNPAFSFARIVAQPASAPDHFRFVKVLQPADKATAYPTPDAGVGDKSSADKTASKRDAKLEAKRALRENR
ncbi:MAG: rod shape-determining protein MreC [Burkholderiales bacterium]|jgi:rod shape-determining protein MreC|nr:rod shape-determining protein MreC [Nitrosomonadaceae bacterium]